MTWLRDALGEASPIVLLPSLILAPAMLMMIALANRSSRRVRIVTVWTAKVAWIVYITWRVLTVAGAYAPSLGWSASALFLLLEFVLVVMLVRGVGLAVLTSTASVTADRQSHWWRSNPPRVAVLIPTYNENQIILERTIVGALGLDYPRFDIFVLDDGRRDWCRHLAGSNGVGYVTRPANDDYKAGNLNHAIRGLLDGPEPPDFIAVFDADFIARPAFLTRTLALMKAGDIAIVQTPQYFYNPDPFQHALRAVDTWPDEQRSWFAAVLPSLDAIGEATCCGTSCLIRTRALVAAGLFPTETLTEDTLLSIHLRELGWRTAYLPEVLSVGLAPEGITEYVAQRMRWYEGGLQATTSKRWGPLGTSSRFRYLLFLEDVVRKPLPAVMRVLWIVALVVFLFSGFSLLQADLLAMFAFLGPVLLARGALMWLSYGSTLPVVSDAHSLLLAAPYCSSAWNFFRRKTRRAFQVTRKGTSRRETQVNWRFAWLPFVLATLLVASTIYAAVDPSLALQDWTTLALAIVWLVFQGMVLAAALAPCFEPLKLRAAERYPTHLKVPLSVKGARDTSTANIVDLSEGGCLLLGAKLSAGAAVELRLPTVGLVRATVRWTDRRDRAGLMFVFDDDAQRTRMMRYVYCSDLFARTILSWNPIRAIVPILRYLPQLVFRPLASVARAGGANPRARGTEV